MTALEPKRRTVAIDFLCLDLDVCGRCRGTDANFETAWSAVRGVLEAAGAPAYRARRKPQGSRAISAFINAPTRLVAANFGDTALASSAT